jgi:hypothetical protein
LKQRYFGGHPDDPVILHRAEIVKRAPPFDSLLDSVLAERFDRDLMGCLRRWEYAVFTAVVDKVDLAAMFPTIKPDPYHRTVELLVTRFAEWLDARQASGDVLAESRGGNEDNRLKEHFRQLMASARTIHPEGPLATRLTSREIKVKPKSNNVAGLQLADLLAHPAMLASIDARAGRGRRPDYGGRVIEVLEAGKYACDASGKIDGTGRLWIP